MQRSIVAVTLAALLSIASQRAAIASPGKPPVAKPPKPAAVTTPKAQHGKPPAPKAAASSETAPAASKTKAAESPNSAPFIKHLGNNPALAARLQTLVPSGMTIEQAATGFRNQGQFIAALHVSRNLNIPFADLKAKMTGTPNESLGRAIQALKPGVDAKQAERLAKFEGKVDIEEAKEDAGDNHASVALKDGPFIKRLQANSQLVALLTPLLPAGTTLASAGQGFKNEAQFIAALHASHNLNIPFAQLKSEMTGRDHDNLAVAIFEQKPSVDALAEARRAQDQARSDLRSSEATVK